jgi:hypothetical protein
MAEEVVLEDELTQLRRENKNLKKRITRKMSTVRRQKGVRCQFITGCKNEKWPTQSFVDKHIAKLDKTFKEEGYVITGASREIERKVVRSCKKNNVRCIIVPANFEALGGASAEHIRNAEVLKNFAPESVTVFSLKPIEDDSVLEYVKRLTLRRNAFSYHEVTKKGK